MVGRSLHRTTGHDGTEDPESLDIEHAITLQHCYTIGKKHSLVLNSHPSHHGYMTTTQNTSKGQKFRSFVRYVWGDTVAANRALLRTPPYDDYLINKRGR
jgi:hypothetical protein